MRGAIPPGKTPLTTVRKYAVGQGTFLGFIFRSASQGLFLHRVDFISTLTNAHCCCYTTCIASGVLCSGRSCEKLTQILASGPARRLAKLDPTISRFLTKITSYKVEHSPKRQPNGAILPLAELLLVHCHQ